MLNAIPFGFFCLYSAYFSKKIHSVNSIRHIESIRSLNLSFSKEKLNSIELNQRTDPKNLEYLACPSFVFDMHDIEERLLRIKPKLDEIFNSIKYFKHYQISHNFNSHNIFVTQVIVLSYKLKPISKLL